MRDVSKLTSIPSATLGGYFAGRHLPPANRPEVLEQLVTACKGNTKTLRELRDELVHISALRRTALVRRAPYRGLEGFSKDDGDVYFGRAELGARLVQMVAVAASSPCPLVPVIGPSGVGKSSLLKAALVPAIEGSDSSYRCVVTTPGNQPKEAIGAAMDAVAGAARAVIVVDQFEELFTLCDSSPQRTEVIDGLLRWSVEPGRDRIVVWGLRADHYGFAAQHESLVKSIELHQVLVPPMGPAALREVIEGPAAAVGLRLESGLVELILNDALDEEHAGDALPHLSHLLNTMWLQSDRRQLRTKDYQAVGGLKGAMRGSAEKALSELTASEQDVARAILLRLVAVADVGLPTRRRASLESLTAFDDGAPEVLAHLAHYRLVTTDTDGATISHEALINGWPRMGAWIEEDRSALLVREMVSRQVAAWNEGDQDPDLLLRGSRLGAIREWMLEHPASLTSTEEQFVAAAIEAEREAQGARERTHRKTRRLLVATAAFAVVAALVSTQLFQARTSLATQRDEAESRQLAFASDELNDRQDPLWAQIGLASWRAAETTEARSALFDATSGAALTRRVGSAQVPVSAVIPGQPLMVFGAADGGIDLVELTDGQFIERSRVEFDTKDDPARVMGLAVSPDGQYLAVTGDASIVRIFDVSDPDEPAFLIDLEAGAGKALTFDGSGEWLIAGDVKGVVRRWAVTGGAFEGRENLATDNMSGAIQDLAASPDGQAIAAVTWGGDVATWPMTEDAVEPAHLQQYGDRAGQLAVAFSADSRRLVTGGKDWIPRLWEVGADQSLTADAEISDLTTWVNEVAFAPDGTELVVATSDNAVRRFDVTDAEPRLLTVLPTSAPVVDMDPMRDSSWSLALDEETTYVWDTAGPVMPDLGATVYSTRASEVGDLLVTTPGPTDGRVLIWDVANPMDPVLVSELTAPEGSGVSSGAATFSNDGSTLLIGSMTGYLVAWDVSAPSDPAIVVNEKIADGPVQQVAFAADDSLVAGVSEDGFLVTVNARSGEVPAVNQTEKRPGMLSLAADSGTLMAPGGSTGDVSLWESTDLSAPLSEIDGNGQAVYGSDMSDEASLLAFGGSRAELDVYDISDPSAPQQLGEALTGPTSTIYSVEFNSDGSRVAAAAQDGVTWIWERTDSGEFELYAALRAGGVPMNSVGWSANDSVLYAGGQLGKLRVWSVDEDQAVGRICSVVGDPITPQEWGIQAPGVEFRDLCD